MRPKQTAYLLLLMAILLSGCVSVGVSPETVSSTFESATLTVTVTLPPPPTIIPPTATPLPTLEPEQAEEIIRALLKESVDCPAPCFWGIVPGQTTLGEVSDIFTHLGLQLEQTNTKENKDFYAVVYDFDGGLSITVILATQDQIAKSLRIKITPEKYQPDIPRKWLAYSPETLINRYGPPSRVNFFLGRAAPTPDYSMVLYFDTVDLIAEYFGYDYTFDGSFVQTCPLINQWNDVRIWMGKNPQYPPSLGVSLEEATSLTLEEFAILMTGDPQNACIKLKENVFP